MAKADLHIHTLASDGKCSPEEVVRLAAENNLSTIAITDHDTYKGYFKAREAGDEYGVRIIPGVEITTDYNDRECHILAYAFDIGHSGFKQKLAEQRLIRVERSKKMVKNLNKLGFDIDYDEVLGEAGAANISRVHIARLMLKKGYAGSIQEVFDRYLGNDKPGYFKSDYTSAEDVISLIHEAGGVAILAHPGLFYLWEDLRFFLNNGIDGIEYIHPTHNFDLQKKYKTWAENFKLLISGGSDFHGRQRDYYHFGNVTVDESYADAILAKAANYKQSEMKK